MDYIRVRPEKKKFNQKIFEKTSSYLKVTPKLLNECIAGRIQSCARLDLR